MIWQLVSQQISARYKQSVLGAVWAVINPLLTLMVYAFVFLVVFRPRVETGASDSTTYVLSLFGGIILFGVFSEVVSLSPMMIVNRPSLVKKVVFPIEVLPVVAFGTAAVFGIIGLGLLLIASLIFGVGLGFKALLLPIVLLPLYPMSVGLGWLLASTGAYVRDTQHVVRALLQLMFFLTPIVWTLDVLPSEKIRTLVMLNPIAVVVESARSLVLLNESPNWYWVVYAMVFALMVYVLGRWWFERTRGGFADVV